MVTNPITIKGSMWMYQEASGKGPVCLAFASGLAASSAAVLFFSHGGVLPSTAAILSFIILAGYLAGAASRTIEIDRDSGEIRTTKKYLGIAHRRNYSLREFSCVRTSTLEQAVEDGYGITRYSVVLSGRTRTLELIAAESEAEGKAIEEQLAQFLDLSAGRSLGSRCMAG